MRNRHGKRTSRPRRLIRGAARAAMAGGASIPLSTSSSDAAPPGEMHAEDLEHSETLKRRMASESWDRLRRLWHEMGAVELDVDSLEHFGYLPLETERADTLLSRLNRIEAGLEQRTGGPDPVQTAVRTVLSMTRERISILSRMRTSMMTRMIPPWTMTFREDLSREFERRLETLERRLAAGDIEGELVDAAADTLLQRMHAWSILGLIGKVYGGGWLNRFPDMQDSSDVITVAMTLVEARHRAAADTLAR
ncbi:MAG: hypothetical protein ACQETZ_02170, partial [Candidatus Fermentibacterota bacterium]